MFVLAPRDSFWWPVEVTQEDGAQTFQVRFRRLTPRQLLAFWRRIQEVTSERPISLVHRCKRLLRMEPLADQLFAELCEQVVLTWRDVVNEEQAPVPSDEATRRLLFSLPLVSGSIIRAYGEALRSGPRKN